MSFKKHAAIVATAGSLIAGTAILAAPASHATRPPSSSCSGHYVTSDGVTVSSLGAGFGKDVTLHNCTGHSYLVNVFCYTNPTKVNSGLCWTKRVADHSSVKISVPWHDAYRYSDWYVA